MANEIQVKKNVGDQVIERVNSLCEAGFTMPADFSYVNAIKMTMLKLQELKDKNGRSALEVCTPVSISTALFQMVTKGLNAALNQGYLIVRGDQLCFQESYFGKVLMVKRIHPDWHPQPVVIREGDVFEHGIDVTTGKKFIIKHEQKFENLDKDFVGGYIYLPTGDVHIMTKKQIMAAWAKSSSREQATHKAFSEKMVGKTLVNSGCNMIINATPSYNVTVDEPLNSEPEEQSGEFQTTEFIEAAEVKEVVAVAPVAVEEKPKARKKKEEPEAQPESGIAPNGDFDF